MKRSWKILRVSIFLITGFFLTAAGQSRSQAVATATLTVIPSLSVEVVKAESSVNGTQPAEFRMNVKGTGNILVVPDSKEQGISKEIHLKQERTAVVNIPVTEHIGKTTITYLSS